MNVLAEDTGVDSRMMRRALDLALDGAGQVSPSPMVGCVIVADTERVVGEGCFLFPNVKHAEALALEQAGELARGATAYISLEPHAHQGRTPPCTEALINAGIKRVVVPIEDPNPLVSGNGIARLREAGVDVDVGVLAREAIEVNDKYLYYMKQKRTFVHLKLAVSLDGRIATRTGDSKWISGTESRARVHNLRHEYDAVLVGSGTALQDDPLLTDRSGLARHRSLERIILDSQLNISPASKLCQTARESPVLVFCNDDADESRELSLTKTGVQVIRIAKGPRDLTGVLRELTNRTIQSVLVEGGAAIAGAFIDARLVDKVSFFVAPLIIGGTEAPFSVGGVGAESLSDAFRLQYVTIAPRGSDIEVTGYPGAIIEGVG